MRVMRRSLPPATKTVLPFTRAIAKPNPLHHMTNTVCRHQHTHTQTQSHTRGQRCASSRISTYLRSSSFHHSAFTLSANYTSDNEKGGSKSGRTDHESDDTNNNNDECSNNHDNGDTHAVAADDSPTQGGPTLSHIDSDRNQPTMVDVSAKRITTRTAHARSVVQVPPSLAALMQGLTAKKTGRGRTSDAGAHRNEDADNSTTNNNDGCSNRDHPELYSPKGPVFATAIIAGTMAVKNTHNLIPFCHPLPIDGCKINIEWRDNKSASGSDRDDNDDNDDNSDNNDNNDSIDNNDNNGDNNHSHVDGGREAKGDEIVIDCSVKVTHKTGVEMEALTGASVAALTIYDMCKAVSHDIIISDTRLIEKTGGKSDYRMR